MSALMERNKETKLVKDALRAAGINAAVRHGTGTAWGWLEINVGSREQFTHQLEGYCECDQCRAAGTKIVAISNNALRIAQRVTERTGEYNGRINVMCQKDWKQKLHRSVEILQEGGFDHDADNSPSDPTAEINGYSQVAA